jgi:hypothetical protein
MKTGDGRGEISAIAEMSAERIKPDRLRMARGLAELLCAFDIGEMPFVDRSQRSEVRGQGRRCQLFSV